MEDILFNETAASTMDFLGLLFGAASVALLVVLIILGVKSWRRRRLCDLRRDHYRREPEA